jgi:hypothetical protein
MKSSLNVGHCQACPLIKFTGLESSRGTLFLAHRELHGQLPSQAPRLEKANLVLAQLAVSLETNPTTLFFMYSGVFVCLILGFDLGLTPWATPGVLLYDRFFFLLWR